MAMPENQLSTLPVFAEFLPPDDRVRASLLVDYEMGGVDIGDPSDGLQVKAWEARVSAGTIQTRPDGAGSWTDVTSDTGITEIALAFDQNMRPTVSYMAGGVAKLYWYDAVAAAYVTTSYSGATSPVVTMDDKRAMQIGLNDVLLFYLQGGRVKHRRQRDRFTIEYDLEDVPTGKTRIMRWGMTVGNRVQLEFGVDADVGASVASPDAIGTFYTDLLTDTLYAVQGSSVVPFIETGLRTCAWRSRRFRFGHQPSFAWLRINGPLTAGVRVRIYANGALWWSSPLMSAREPIRVPTLRARDWEIEVESTSRITSVMLASSVAELQVANEGDAP